MRKRYILCILPLKISNGPRPDCQTTCDPTDGILKRRKLQRSRPERPKPLFYIQFVKRGIQLFWNKFKIEASIRRRAFFFVITLYFSKNNPPRRKVLPTQFTV